MGRESPPQYQVYPHVGNQLPPPYSPGDTQVITQQPAPYNLGNPQPSYPQPSPYYPGDQQTVQPSAPASVIQVPVVGVNSISMTCPTCNSTIQTEVNLKQSKHANRMAAVLCLLGCWLCCCCAPYCMTTCMDADHVCPCCKNVIGTHKC